MKKITNAFFTLTVFASPLILNGCAVNSAGTVAIDPNTLIQTIISTQPALAQLPPGVTALIQVPVPVVEETYVAAPQDEFIVAVVPADVVVYHGDTYFWHADEYGHRHREFYMHGNHRNDVFQRQKELHAVMERNGGRFPDHDKLGHDVKQPLHAATKEQAAGNIKMAAAHPSPAAGIGKPGAAAAVKGKAVAKKPTK